MNDREQVSLESELRRLKPSRPPEAFLARLERVLPARAQLHERPAPSPVALMVWRWLRRWLAPAAIAAGVALGLLIWRFSGPEPEQARGQEPAPAPPAVQADDVAIGQHLLTSYDAVVELPGGQPVRFRCREWMDEVVWRDSSRGLVIEQKTPRLEVIPVRLEVY